MVKKVLQIFVLVLLVQSIHGQKKDTIYAKEKAKDFYITKGKGIEFHFF